MIKAVIFDMDGVIADTEPIHEKARNSLLSELGLDVERISPRAIGRSKRSFWGEVAKENGLTQTADELTVAEFDRIIETCRGGIEATKGLSRLCGELKARGVAIAVASSSDRRYVDEILEAVGLSEYYATRAAGDEVENAKPAPDVYLKALGELGIAADEALAVEDSDTGAKAAKAAGIKCVGYDAVENPALKQSFAACSYKVGDMFDVLEIVCGEGERFAL